MQTLAQFKIDSGIESIQLMQGKGRKFATLPDGSNLFASEHFSKDKEMFVIVNDGSKEGHEHLKGSLWLVNSTVKAAELI